MRKLVRWTLFAALALGGQATVSASGITETKDVSIIQPVTLVMGGAGSSLIIYSTIASATGALGSARNAGSGATDKEIGCKLVPTLHGPEAFCVARAVPASPGGLNQLSCVTRDPQLISMVSAMNGDSVVSFYTFTTNGPDHDYDVGECVLITVENSSRYEPKK